MELIIHANRKIAMKHKSNEVTEHLMKLAILNEYFGMGGLEKVSVTIGQSLQKKYDAF